jgi:acetyltransferase-like isoleucine patch superfamily enzyme
MLLKSIVRFCIPRTWIVRVRSLNAPKCKKGRHVYIAPSVQLIGAANIAIGDNSCISERTWINVNQRRPGEFEFIVGDNCFIGRDNFFSSGNAIYIGHYTLTTIGCKFICSSHVIDDPMIPYISSGTTQNDSIRVGVNCFFGAGSMVIGNVNIGHGSVIGAGSQVTKNVPPFSIVIGNPAKIIKRYSFEKEIWIDGDSVGDDGQLGYPNEVDYLAQLRALSPALSMPLIAASSHFGNL